MALWQYGNVVLSSLKWKKMSSFVIIEERASVKAADSKAFQIERERVRVRERERERETVFGRPSNLQP